MKVVVVKYPVRQGSFVDSNDTLGPRFQQLDRSVVGHPLLQRSSKPVLCVNRRYAPGVWTEVDKGPVEQE